MPGVLTPAGASGALGALLAAPGTLGIFPGPLPNPVSGAPVLYSEPPLPCYVFAGCPSSAKQPARRRIRHRQAAHGRRSRPVRR